jgi:CheY-like chemotaxis protein
MTQTGSNRRICVLVIEDNPADVELLRLALRQAGLDCELLLLEDGAEALTFLRRVEAGDASVPDLVLLDLNLPKNDGAEVLQAMRASPPFSKVQVAVLSSSASTRERARIEQLGVGRYITKPADLDEFMRIGSTIREMLDRPS